MRRVFLLLFITHLISRILFTSIIGFNNNYRLQDSPALVHFADCALAGDFNFQYERFIVSPLFIIVCAAFKLVFGSYWNVFLLTFQLLLSTLSGVYIFKIALLLFRNERIALLSSLLFAVFPPTLWFVSTFSQEWLFQALFIFTVYYLIKSLQTSFIGYVIVSAVFFSLTYLTKSHILIFALFIPLIFFHRFRFEKKTFLFSGIFASVAVLFSIPYGIYHLKKNGVYVISSNGSGYQFYLGNTNAGYMSIVNVPEQGTEEFRKVEDINKNAGYFNGSVLLYDSLMAMPQSKKQKFFVSEAFMWIKNNPLKFLELKLCNCLFFLMPGVSFRHYEFHDWILSLLISFPIFFLAYISMLKEIRKDFSGHSVIFYLFITMFLFSTIWYVQNRFRTITIEPFYIIYAASAIYALAEKFSFAPNILARLSFFYLGNGI